MNLIIKNISRQSLMLGKSYRLKKSAKMPKKQYVLYIKNAEKIQKFISVRFKFIISVLEESKEKNILTKILKFDCVWGFSLGYMHAILIGVNLI